MENEIKGIVVAANGGFQRVKGVETGQHSALQRAGAR